MMQTMMIPALGMLIGLLIAILSRIVNRVIIKKSRGGRSGVYSSRYA